MSVQTKAILKSYFETGDIPTQENFEDLIDTINSQAGGAGIKEITDGEGNISGYEVDVSAVALNISSLTKKTYSSPAAAFVDLVAINSTVKSAVIGIRIAYIDTDLGELKEYYYDGESWIASGGGNLEADDENSIIVVTISGVQYALEASKLESPENPVIAASGNSTDESRSVSISCSTDGALIYYTLDGSDPTKESTLYQGSFTLSANINKPSTTATVKAIAIKNGRLSDIVTLDIVTSRHINKPSITASSNEYALSREVILSCSTTGVNIYYTIDGSTPNSNSTPYTEPIVLDSSKTVKCIAIGDGWQDSAVASLSVVVGTLKMYYGLVDTGNEPTTEADIMALTSKEQKTLPFTYAISSSATGQKKVCYAYASNLGSLSSIKDGNGTQYLNNFTKSTIGAYNLYIMKNAASQASMTYTFSK